MKNTFGRVADRVGGGHKVFTKLTEVRLNSRLIEVKNWQDLAEAANYSAAALSQRCQISTRQLERFFLESVGYPPHRWLNQLRQRRGVELLTEGRSVKETALSLGYKTVPHFSREFKRWNGYPPSHHRQRQVQPPPA